MKTSLKFRHSDDKAMIKDCVRNYEHFSFDEDSVVLDLGCNIGGLMHWLKDSNIKQYIGIDAHQENITFFKENNLPDRSNFEIFHGAASTSKEDTISFWVRPDERGTTNGQTHPNNAQKRKRTVEMVVPNYNINELVNKYKPTHLKLDIKGTEMIWFEETNGVIPDCVQQFFVEVYTKKASQLYDKKFVPIQKENFDIKFIYPTEKFRGMGDWYDCPNLGLPKVNAQLYDINVLMVRK